MPPAAIYIDKLDLPFLSTHYVYLDFLTDQSWSQE